VSFSIISILAFASERVDLITIRTCFVIYININTEVRNIVKEKKKRTNFSDFLS